MVDDAHALGVLGKHGRGTAEYFGLEDDVDIYMGTFSKSLASLGGYIASSARVIDYITHTSRPYIFSASMTPASVASVLTALRILEREPERMEALKNISSYMREGLKKMGIQIIESQTPIIPIYTYDDEKAFMALIGSEYSLLWDVNRTAIITEAKIKIGNDMSTWTAADLTTLQGILKRRQQETAKKEKLAGAKNNIRIMRESVLRDRVAAFLDAHPEFCDEFLK